MTSEEDQAIEELVERLRKARLNVTKESSERFMATLPVLPEPREGDTIAVFMTRRPEPDKK